jgi:hypothetical protein
MGLGNAANCSHCGSRETGYQKLSHLSTQSGATQRHAHFAINDSKFDTLASAAVWLRKLIGVRLFDNVFSFQCIANAFLKFLRTVFS